VLERGLLRMDPERHTCTWKKEHVTLTVTEFLILQALASRPGVVKSRNALMDAAYFSDVFGQSLRAREGECELGTLAIGKRCQEQNSATGWENLPPSDPARRDQSNVIGTTNRTGPKGPNDIASLVRAARATVATSSWPTQLHFKSGSAPPTIESSC
jgi:hypothetical protein